MAVTETRHVAATPATTTTITASGLLVDGVNPTILALIGIQHDTAQVSGVSWSLGGGTPYKVAAVTFGTSTGGDQICRAEIWAVPAPTAGTGNLAATSNTPTTPMQLDAILFNGADQTTPCPISDADTDGVNGYTSPNTFTLTPTNVGSSDGMAAIMAHSHAGDDNGWATGTQVYQGQTTTINILTGYRLAVGSMQTNALINTPNGAIVALVGVRIQSPAVAPATQTLLPMSVSGQLRT